MATQRRGTKRKEGILGRGTARPMHAVPTTELLVAFHAALMRSACYGHRLPQQATIHAELVTRGVL